MYDVDLIEDDFPGNLRFLEGREENWEQWPSIGFEIDDVKWQGAEPDVGIMSAYIDDFGVTYWVGDTKFTDEAAFVAELHRVIGADIEESEADLASMIEARVRREVESIEPDDGDYYEDY